MRISKLTAALIAAGILGGITGCKDKQSSQAPEALELTAAPASLEEAFAKAAPDVRTEAERASEHLKHAEYGVALILLQRLSARPELTADQRTMATRSMLTAQEEVNKAADNGDVDSKKLLRYRAMTK